MAEYKNSPIQVVSLKPPISPNRALYDYDGSDKGGTQGVPLMTPGVRSQGYGDVSNKDELLSVEDQNVIAIGEVSIRGQNRKEQKDGLLLHKQRGIWSSDTTPTTTSYSSSPSSRSSTHSSTSYKQHGHRSSSRRPKSKPRVQKQLQAKSTQPQVQGVNNNNNNDPCGCNFFDPNRNQIYRSPCQIGVIPMRSAAFQAPRIPLPKLCSHLLSDEDGEDDEEEDGVQFQFKPQTHCRTEVTFTIEPKTHPPWLTMLNCGFKPMVNCSAPPCYLSSNGNPGMEYVGGTQSVVNRTFGNEVQYSGLANFPTLNQIQNSFPGGRIIDQSKVTDSNRQPPASRQHGKTKADEEDESEESSGTEDDESSDDDDDGNDEKVEERHDWKRPGREKSLLHPPFPHPHGGHGGAPHWHPPHHTQHYRYYQRHRYTSQQQHPHIPHHNHQAPLRKATYPYHHPNPNYHHDDHHDRGGLKPEVHHHNDHHHPIPNYHHDDHHDRGGFKPEVHHHHTDHHHRASSHSKSKSSASSTAGSGSSNLSRSDDWHG